MNLVGILSNPAAFQGLVSLIFGILILMFPKILNYLIAFYFIITGATLLLPFLRWMPYLLDRQPIEFKDRTLLFIDLELTGLDVSQHEIIEVAALVTRPPDFAIANSYYTKVLPVHPKTAAPEALEITGYSAKSWQDAIPLRQALVELSSLAPDCLLAGWAVQTEWDFLNAALETEHLPIFYDFRLLEVYSLAYAKFLHSPDIVHLNLSNTAASLGISIDRHKPDSDIRATYEIFKHLINQNPASK